MPKHHYAVARVYWPDAQSCAVVVAGVDASLICRKQLSNLRGATPESLVRLREAWGPGMLGSGEICMLINDFFQECGVAPVFIEVSGSFHDIKLGTS